MQNLLNLTDSYMSGEDINHNDILNRAVDVLIDDKLPEELQHLGYRALQIINKDFEEKVYFDKYIAMVEELIEDISAMLADYLDK